MDRAGQYTPTATGAAGRSSRRSDQGRWSWGIVGFGLILVLSIGGVGILLTHKVAGPLYKISSFFGRIRDNRLGPAPAKLRKGDELQNFYLVVQETAPGPSAAA